MSYMRFDRPVSADADTQELEYISFLHQSGVNVRPDCSIQDVDIQVFLRSRYGIDATIETVRNTILRGMGGSDGDTEVIDLMELTAILLIPVLVKAAASMQTENQSEQASEFVENRNNLPSELILPPEGLIDFVSKVILHDVTGSSKPQPLTIELVQKIFLSYGEIELSKDTKLHQQMINCIRTASEEDIESDGAREPAMFNGVNFASLLTYDIQRYDFRNEVQTITPDESLLPPQARSRKHMEGNLPSGSNEDGIKPWHRIFTAPALDIAAGTFRSKILLTLLWATAILNYGNSYITGNSKFQITPPDCTESTTYGRELSCQSGGTVSKWLYTFVFTGILGFLFTSFGSIGNTVRCKRSFHPLIGCVPPAAVAYATSPAVLDWSDAGETGYFAYFMFFSSSLCVLLHVHHAIEMALPSRINAKFPVLNEMFNYGLNKGERLGKQAMAHKLNRMVENSLALVKNADVAVIHRTYNALALHEYATSSESTTEQIGGILWTWKNTWNENLFKVEGVWLSARTTASNVAQVIVCILVLCFSVFYARRAITGFESNDGNDNRSIMLNYATRFFNQTVDESLLLKVVTKLSAVITSFLLRIYDSGIFSFNCTDSSLFNTTVDTVCEYSDIACERSQSILAFCNVFTNETYVHYLLQNNTYADEIVDEVNLSILSLLNASGFGVDVITEQVHSTILQASQNTIESLYPTEKYMVSVPAYVFVVVAFVTAVMLAASYIPQITSTVLKLRCGMIPMMQNPDNKKYRVAPHTVAVLTGSLFWGCFVSSMLTGAACALIVFFFLWQGTITAAQKVVAIVLALVAITLIKIMVALPIQMRYFSAFYRRKPARANMAMLALEWANFMVTAGIILARMASLTIVALFSVGRIYKPFLAPGVGVIGPLELDGYPTINIRELLAHEAHRHPYIELLGLVYLMKLKFADDFGKAPGSCWRLVFVYALMPWLQKYRIRSETRNDRLKDSKLQFLSIRQIPGEQATNQIGKQTLSDPDLENVETRLETVPELSGNMQATSAEVDEDLEQSGNESFEPMANSTRPSNLEFSIRSDEGTNQIEKQKLSDPHNESFGIRFESVAEDIGTLQAKWAEVNEDLKQSGNESFETGIDTLTEYIESLQAKLANIKENFNQFEQKLETTSYLSI